VILRSILDNIHTREKSSTIVIVTSIEITLKANISTPLMKEIFRESHVG